MCSHIPRWHFKSGYKKTEAPCSCLLPQKNQKRSILRAEKYGDLTTAEHDPQRRTCISEQLLIDNKDIILNSRGAFLSMEDLRDLVLDTEETCELPHFRSKRRRATRWRQGLYVRGIRVHWRQGVESAHRRCTKDLWTWWMSSWFRSASEAKAPRLEARRMWRDDLQKKEALMRRSKKCYPMPPSVFVCLLEFDSLACLQEHVLTMSKRSRQWGLFSFASVVLEGEAKSHRRTDRSRCNHHSTVLLSKENTTAFDEQKRTGRWEHRGRIELVRQGYIGEARLVVHECAVDTLRKFLIRDSRIMQQGCYGEVLTQKGQGWLACRGVRVDAWPNRCNWAQYKISMSNDSEIKVLTKSECCLCLISVARKVTSTPPVNRSSTLQSFGRFTDNTHAMETGHPGAEISHQQVSHFSQCAEEPNKGFALLKVRGSSRHGFALSRILELQIEIDKHEFLAEFTKRARCEVTRRTTPDVKRRSTFSW